jgi:hypothetical protein
MTDGNGDQDARISRTQLIVWLVLILVVGVLVVALLGPVLLDTVNGG